MKMNVLSTNVPSVSLKYTSKQALGQKLLEGPWEGGGGYQILLDQEMSPVVSQATSSADFDLSRFQYIISHPTLLSFKIILTNVI